MSKPKFVDQAQGEPSAPADSDDVAIVDEVIQGALGRRLRESWDAIVKEEVPRQFGELLEQLKNSEQRGSGGD